MDGDEFLKSTAFNECELILGVELGESLVSFNDGVVAEVLRKEKFYGSLDILRAESLLLLVADELGGFESNLIEHISNKGVDDGHTLLGNSDVVTDGLQYLVDVDREGVVVFLLVVGLDLCFFSGSFA